MVALSLPNHRQLQRLSLPAYAAAVLLLLAVYLFPPINGSHRWIRVAGFSLQPSELAKVAFVLMLARCLMYRDNLRGARGLLAPLILALIPTLLILKEPDLGTALVFLPVCFVMLFVAGARWADLSKIAACGLLAALPLWTQLSAEQKSRVTALFEQSAPHARPSDDGYHLHQSKQMFALGGIWGSALAGDAVDDPAAYHLPEAHGDFIFSVIGERYGWWGAAGLLALVLLLAWRGLAIARRTIDPFGRLVAVGVVALFVLQTLINTGMAVGLLPVTGMSLPLVSYGGSGLLAHAAALGLLLNIGMRPGYEMAGGFEARRRRR
jgi:cell division protein FtsW (lipid II flippase)